MSAIVFGEDLQELRCKTPDTYLLGGTFKPSTNGVVDKAEKNLALLGTSHEWDTVVEAKTAGVAGNSITVALTADATLNAKASISLGPTGAGCGKLDSVLEFNTAGVGGNAWKVQVVPGGAGDGASVYEDTTNKILTIVFETAVTKVTDVEALFPTTNFSVKTGGTGANVLAVATDLLDNSPLSGGTAVATVTRTGTAFVFKYKAGVTTVTQLEALISGLSGDDDILDIKTPGTGANAIQTTTAFVATALAGGADATDASLLIAEGCVSVSRAGVGLYDVVTRDRFKGLIAGVAELNCPTTPQGIKGRVIGYTPSTKAIRIVLYQATDGVIVDPTCASDDRVHFIVHMAGGPEY